MVALDLLDLDSAPNGKATASAAPSLFSRGDVLLAKYGSTNCFYWAKVKKVYKNSSGAELCNVEWLRPQAGAQVGKLYVLHDGHDETWNGDALTVSLHVRRPCAADLTGVVPPGAAACANKAAGHCPRGAGISDLLGEPIVETSTQQEPNSNATFFASWGMGSSCQAAPQPFLQSSMASAMQMPMNGPMNGSPAGQGWQNLGVPMNGSPAGQGWQSLGMNGPGYQARPPPQNMSAPTPFGLQPKMATQQQSSFKPVTAAASMSELEAAFASDLMLKPSGGNRKPEIQKATKCDKDQNFDFISDMMSGALNGR